MLSRIARQETIYSVYSHGVWIDKLNTQLSEIRVHDLDEILDDPESLDTNARGVIIALESAYLFQNEKKIHSWVRKNNSIIFRLILISASEHGFTADNNFKDNIHSFFPETGQPDVLARFVENAIMMVNSSVKCEYLEKELGGVYSDMRSLTKVGKALLTERNFDNLIGLILTEVRKLVGADGGSMYVVEKPEKKDEKPTKLRFKKSALNLEASEFTLSIDANSIAGYVALKGEPLLIDDVYNLTADHEFHFNPEFDKAHDYYTKSMMLIPMKNHLDDVIGVIQLINKKADGYQTVTLEEMKGTGVISFTDRCYEIASALAGQAAMAIENYNLVIEIKDLFEGFVRAAVTAIEQRDPTTSGHSFRVAEYTSKLAQNVDGLNDGNMRDVKFSTDQIRELRYASLLHDFGKVGVREEVLVKGKKLYEHELEIIQWRFRYLRKAMENEYLVKKVEIIDANNSNKAELLSILENKKNVNLADLSTMESAVLHANEPTILEEGEFNTLEVLQTRKIHLDTGAQVPLITESEFLSLSVKRGTLDAKERAEIESHVTHTYQFLIQIPWTRDLANLPDIAHYHHEKLDGSGYPHGIPAEKIPIQSKMMTISDIYDALTAWDRPYKKALPVEKALDILKEEADNNRIDARLLEVFIEAEIFKAENIILT